MLWAATPRFHSAATGLLEGAMQQAQQEHRGRTLRGPHHAEHSSSTHIDVNSVRKKSTSDSGTGKVPFALGFAKAAAMQAGPRRDDTGEALPLHLNDGEPTATLRVSTTESSMSEEVTAAPTPEYANTV